MCGPAAIYAGVTLAAAAMSAYGQRQQGKAAKKAAQYNARVNENNAQVATWQANDARLRGQEEARRERLKTRSLIGQQKSALAANGIALDFGSPLELLVETAENGELDASTITANAEREAYGHEVRSSNYMAAAGLEIFQGDTADQMSKIGAATTILSGAGQAYGASFGGGGVENMGGGPRASSSGSVPIPASKPARY